MIRVALWNGLWLAVVAGLAPRLARLSRASATAATAGLVALLLLDVALLRDPVLAARWLPVDGLLHGLPLVLPLTVAVGVTALPHLGLRNRVARGALVAAGLVGALASYRFWITPRAEASARPLAAGQLQLQSAPETCVPATLVNLARAHGVEGVSEAEVAHRAETRRGLGTPLLGALDAARELLAPTGRRVWLRGLAFEDLLEAELPVMAEVALGGSSRTAPAGLDRSWIRGAPHVVLVERIDLDAGRVHVIDPDVGREVWPLADFRALWTGATLGTDAR